MWILNIAVLLTVTVLAVMYFMPYRKLKDKIFRNAFYNIGRIVKIEYTNGKSKIVLKRANLQGNEWNMVGEKTWLADNSKMNRLIQKINDIVVEDRLLKADAEDRKYDLGRNGKLLLNTDLREIEIDFGDRADGYDDCIFAKKAKDKDIIVISSSILSVLPKGDDDFKNLYLFKGFFPQVSMLDVKSERKSYTLMRISGGWAMHGKNVFDDKVQPIVTSLLELEASGFVDSNKKLSAKPVITITLKIQKANIYRYFFESEEDNSIYYVPIDGEIMYIRRTIIDSVLEYI